VLVRRSAAGGASMRGRGDRDPTSREGGLVTTRVALISDNWRLLRVPVIARRVFSEYNGTVRVRGREREGVKEEARRNTCNTGPGRALKSDDNRRSEANRCASSFFDFNCRRNSETYSAARSYQKTGRGGVKSACRKIGD
jgi:hypothetical protein